MRDILFKAKRIDNGEWVYWNILGELLRESGKRTRVAVKKGATTSYYDYIHQIAHLIDKSTICQCTGLTDKNENKIWENDVVRFVCVTPSVKQEMIKQVKYRRHGGISPFWWSFECNRCGSFCDIKEVEVVGNTHDNPELLGGSE